MSDLEFALAPARSPAGYPRPSAFTESSAEE